MERKAMRRWVSLVLLTAFLVQALPATTPACAQSTIHVVQRGETLYSIARRYGVSVDAICAANGITDPTRIYVGQELVIPVPPSPAEPTPGTTPVPTQPTHVVQPGESLYRIALRYSTTVMALAEANGITHPAQTYVGRTLVIPDGATADIPSATATVQPTSAMTITLPPPTSEPAPTATPTPATSTHTVQRGETLSAIARRYGVTVQALVWTNNIANPSLIVPGQVLVIPGPGRVVVGTPGGPKRIVVDISEQHLYGYEGDVLVYSFVASTGKPGSGTATGTYSVLSKFPNAYASTWDLQMPYFMGIYWSGSLQNGIHALPILSNGQTLWAGYLGTPVSFGCIILSTANAQTLYYWADVGTPVIIQY
jgi:LysM repeat protein